VLLHIGQTTNDGRGGQKLMTTKISAKNPNSLLSHANKFALMTFTTFRQQERSNHPYREELGGAQRYRRSGKV